MESTDLTLEPLGRKGFQMYQRKDGFRFGTDTVLLSWYTASFIRDGREAKLFEVGANCGAATLLVAARRDNACVDALEIDHDAYEVLKKNVELNDLGSRVNAYEGDVRELPSEVKRKQYDIVFMNPPFFKSGTGPSPDQSKPGKLKGRFENNGTLEDFIKEGSARLVPSAGIMCVVMTARRSDEVICLMGKHGIKPFNLMFVHPSADKNAEMVLVAGKKTTNDTQLEIMPPLVLNDKERINSIYNKEHTDCFI
jgi:tRNA1(Val) A37 N6-methylase TrmN6